jgi:AraC-like DNA-binding protein
VGGPKAPELETLAIQLAAAAVRLGTTPRSQPAGIEASTVARITRVVRFIEHEQDVKCTLADFAGIAGLSPYHFLRVFVAATGVTPHQYLLRVRLRRAALSLASRREKVIDLALDCGFNDISNFNRAFRAEFGVSPRAYRARAEV